MHRSALLPYEDLRLHTAALEGDLETIERLVSEGLNLNSRDLFLSTPLHLASLNGHHKVVESLLRHGATVDSVSYSNVTPLMLAIKHRQTATVEKLVQAGADPNFMPFNKSTPYLWLVHEMLLEIQEINNTNNLSAKTRLHDYLNILKILAVGETGNPIILGYSGEPSMPISLLMEIFSALPKEASVRDQLKIVEKETQVPELIDAYLDTKKLLHTFSMDYEYKLESETFGELQVKAEGHFRKLTTALAQTSIGTFIQQIPDNHSLKKTLFTTVYDALKIANISISATFEKACADKILAAYQAGEMVIFPSGWQGHIITLAIMEDYFIVANSGQRFDLKPSGAMIYKINHPELIDESFILQVLNNNDQMALEYDLHYQLGLSLIDTIEAPDQTVGNCGWQSFLPMVESLIYLQLTEMGLEPIYAKSLADDYFQEWEEFHKDNVLEDYLEKHPEAPFNMLMDIFLHESQDNSDSATIRAEKLAAHLSENHYADAFAEFVTNQPMGWLGLDGILEEVGVDLNNGRRSVIDIQEVIEYDNSLGEVPSLVPSFEPLPALIEPPLSPSWE